MLGMNVEKLNNQHLDKSNVIEIHLVPTPTREKARYSSCHLNSFTRFLCQGDKASFWDNSDYTKEHSDHRPLPLHLLDQAGEGASNEVERPPV